MRGKFGGATLALVLALVAAAPGIERRRIPESSLTPIQQASHVLSRLTFGARPGDLDAVLTEGPTAFIERQLNPDSVDDASLERRLIPLDTIRMSTQELAELFPRPGQLKRMVEDSFGVVRVRGEITGFKRAASGHLYFSLKDPDAVLDAVCWRGTAARLRLDPEDGMEAEAPAPRPGRSRAPRDGTRSSARRRRGRGR